MDKRWRYLANDFDEEVGLEPSASWPTWLTTTLLFFGMLFLLFGMGTCGVLC